jgi:hypothetical protein
MLQNGTIRYKMVVLQKGTCNKTLHCTKRNLPPSLRLPPPAALGRGQPRTGLGEGLPPSSPLTSALLIFSQPPDDYQSLHPPLLQQVWLTPPPPPDFRSVCTPPFPLRLGSPTAKEIRLPYLSTVLPTSPPGLRPPPPPALGRGQPRTRLGEGFAQNLLHAGWNALFAKQDMSDAYKLVPTDPESWRLFGFKWLGKFFHELAPVFGNKAAPAQFDDLAETIVTLAVQISKVPRKWITSQLDDTIVVSPVATPFTQQFLVTFQQICTDTNLPLAPPCPKFEKAFGLTTRVQYWG